MELGNNTILITGGAAGLGFELASKLIELGNTVINTGRNKKELEEAQAILPVINIIQSDVSKVEEINRLYNMVTRKFQDLT